MRLYRTTRTAPVGRPGHWTPRELDFAPARRLEGAIAVRHQLAWVASCNAILANLDVGALFEPRNRGLAAAIAIGYRQCFNSGSRKFRLTRKHVEKSAAHSLALHDQILAVADKAVAHADSWLDQVAVAMYVNQHGEFAGLADEHMQAALLRKDEHEQLVSALADLDAAIASEIMELRVKCVAHIETLAPSYRLASAEVFLVPPAAVTNEIKP